jgi:hypothetical protein
VEAMTLRHAAGEFMYYNYSQGVQIGRIFAYWAFVFFEKFFENDKSSLKIWGRCYDHIFLRFLPIFGEKNGVFL